MSRRPGPTGLAQALVDGVLGLDEGLRDDLAALAGRLVHVRVEGLDLDLWMRLGPRGPVVLAPEELAERDPPRPDVTVAGAPFSLLALAGRARAADALGASGVRVTGDVGLAQELAAIAARAELDWEEPLARLLGDAPAHALARALRGLAGAGREAGERLLDDLGEYLRYESDLVAARDAVRAFADAVDDARDDAERLEARVARLERERGA